MQKEAGVILEPHNACTELESGCNGHVLRSNNQTGFSHAQPVEKCNKSHVQYGTSYLYFEIAEGKREENGFMGYILLCEFRNVKCIVPRLLFSVCIIQCDWICAYDLMVVSKKKVCCFSQHTLHILLWILNPISAIWTQMGNLEIKNELCIDKTGNLFLETVTGCPSWGAFCVLGLYF